MPFAFTVLLRSGKPERGMVSDAVSCPYFRRPLSASSGTCRANRSGGVRVELKTGARGRGARWAHHSHAYCKKE